VCRRVGVGRIGVALTAPVGRGSVRAGASRLAAVYDENPKNASDRVIVSRLTREPLFLLRG
jgi:hypothetical protein